MAKGIGETDYKRQFVAIICVRDEVRGESGSDRKV